MSRMISLEEVDTQSLEEIVVKVNRCATVVKGGKRFSFSALVALGNRNGVVGYGFGKANEVPQAVDKAVKDAQRRLINIPLQHGTISHEVKGSYSSSQVLLFPASPGTGIIAGNTVRAVLELAGIHNILTKSNGSNSSINLIKAVFDGLSHLRTQKEVERIRGVKVDYASR